MDTGAILTSPLPKDFLRCWEVDDKLPVCADPDLDADKDKEWLVTVLVSV